MNGIVHPFRKDLYERDETDMRVRVTRTNGEVGYYAGNGRWLEGAKFDADSHLCEWIMAPRSVHRLSAVPASH